MADKKERSCDFSVESIIVQGWQAQLLRTSYLALIFLPQLGGRIVSLRIGNNPNVFYPDRKFTGEKAFIDNRFLEADIEELRNWGGYNFEIIGDRSLMLLFNYGVYQMTVNQDSVVMESCIDKKTQLQLKKRIQIVKKNEIHCSVSVYNYSNKTHKINLQEHEKLCANVYTITPNDINQLSEALTTHSHRITKAKKMELLGKRSLNIGKDWTSIFHKSDFHYDLLLADLPKKRLFTVHPISLSNSAIAWERKYEEKLEEFSLNNHAKKKHLEIRNRFVECELKKKGYFSIKYLWKFSLLKKIGQDRKRNRLARLIKPKVLLRIR